MRFCTWIFVLLITAQAAAEECIPIGVIGSFRRAPAGTAEPFGSEMQRGADLAIAKLKTQEQGQCLTLRYFDIANSVANIPDTLTQAAAKKIYLFLGLGTSDMALMALEPLQTFHGILVTPTATSNELLSFA